MKVGDIVEIDGKKVLVTYVNGDNYSYTDAPEAKEEPEEKPAPKKRAKK